MAVCMAIMISFWHTKNSFCLPTAAVSTFSVLCMNLSRVLYYFFQVLLSNATVTILCKPIFFVSQAWLEIKGLGWQSNAILTSAREHSVHFHIGGPLQALTAPDCSGSRTFTSNALETNCHMQRLSVCVCMCVFVRMCRSTCVYHGHSGLMMMLLGRTHRQ